MAPTDSLKKRLARGTLNGAALILASPLAAACWIESHYGDHAEAIFRFCSELVSLIPGPPGVILRRAFYAMVLEQCSTRCFIGFGSIFAHRAARVGHGVFIGPYARIGSADIGDFSLIGSRASLISGRYQHELDENGHWGASSADTYTRISIGANAWVGEGAIIMNDVGNGSMVAAGAVVSNKVPESTMVGGNPARFVRKLTSRAGMPTQEDATEHV